MANNTTRTDAAYAETLRRIELCRKERQSALNLIGLGLTTLPPEIGQLTALTELDLDGNQLTTLLPEIGQLMALRKLGLSSNQLMTLPPEIGQLTALRTLDLDSNELTTLPPEIGQLTALTELDLDSNQLTTLPPEIGQLTALTKLDLSSNKLMTLPPKIGQLRALTTLDLDSNQLTTLPPEIGQLTTLTTLDLQSNQLTSLPSEIGQLTALTTLDLSSNQLATLPPQIGQLTALTALFLVSNQLTTMPPEIGQLAALTELHLASNQLTTMPPEIRQLTALTKLDLDANQLTTLPPGIGQLTALTKLDLDGNQLTTLPLEIGQLTALTELRVHGNQLTTLPLEIGQLTALTMLDLDGNQLMTLPLEIGQLTALAILDLDGNQLRTLPPEIGQLTALMELHLASNQLTTLPPEIGQLTALLNLHNNPALGIPPEVLGPRWGKLTRREAKPKQAMEILDWYFRSLLAKVKRPILEAKVILVGWGAVGKTSLRRRLTDGRFDAKEDTTHKIEISPWTVKIGADHVMLRVWDFGGQEIMHATHQFFLTKRSLYVLVLAGREKTQGAQDAEYWLRLIKGFGGDSPAIVVLNKQHQYPFDLNRQSLQDKYPFIKGFIQTDCQPPLHLDELKAMILQGVDQLPELRREFDANWMAIKDEVTDLKQKGRKRMAASDYFRLCEQEEEHDPQWQKWLLGFLHDLGIVVCFHDDYRLANDGVLDPQWVVDGIYKFLNEPTLRGGDGRVTLKHIRRLLPIADYSDDDVRILVDLMVKFQLAFWLNDRQTILVAPELMTEQETNWKQHFPDLEKCLRFEFKYDFLPEGLVPRFIVATHDLSKDGQRWRSGVILRQGKNAALVRGDASGSPPRIQIAVNGPVATRRVLLALIRRDFEKINGSITGLEVRERVPVRGKPWLEPLDYEKLLLREIKGKKTVELEWGDEILELPLAELLDGIEPKEKRKRRAERIRLASGINVEGDLVVGEKHVQEKNYTNTGTNRGIIGDNNQQTITDSFNHCADPAAAERELVVLQKLLAELQSKLPEDKKEEAALHAMKLEEAVKTNEPKSRSWYSLSATGLLEASKWVKDFSSNIGVTILKLGKAIWPDFEMPESK